MTNKKEDPRALRSKEYFKTAVIELLNEQQSLSKLTVKMIADRAQLNRATFYLHYKDTKDLMRAVVYDLVDDLTVKIDSFFQQKKRSSTEEFILFLDYFYLNRKLFSVLFDEPRFKMKLHNALRDSLLMNDGHVITNIKFKNTSKDILTASLIGIIMWWLSEGIHYSSEYIAGEIIKSFR